MTDAVLCDDGPVGSLVGLSLVPEYRRRHGALYDGINRGRVVCHTYGRGKNQHLMLPGWPYSVVAALETGRTSWTALLDAVRLQPGADVAAVTTAQTREVVERLIAAGQWRLGDPEILVVLDAAYDAPRIAHRHRVSPADAREGDRQAQPDLTRPLWTPWLSSQDMIRAGRWAARFRAAHLVSP
ncbi:MAG TPA: transposase [Actinophytocola sp.]